MPRTFKVLSAFVIVCLLFVTITIPAGAAVFDCSVITDVPQDECEALVFLYNSTNGDSWTHHDNWLTGTSVGNWFGVTVIGSHVYYLILDTNNLVGPIPPQIKNLASVTQLNFNHNHLTGSIPAQIANISALKYLYLVDNDLTGPIPTGIFSLPNILEVLLYENHLSGPIPSNIGNATTLTKFLAGYNSLSGPLPASIGNLSNLTNLTIEYNDLYGPLPTEIKNLPSSLYLAINNSGYWSTDTEVQAYLTSRQPGWQNYQCAQGLNPLVGGTVGWGELADTANFKPKFQFSKFFNNSGVAAEKYLIQMYSESLDEYYLQLEKPSSEVCPTTATPEAIICEYIPTWSDFLFPPIPGDYYWLINTWSGTDWIDKDGIRYFTIASPPVGNLPNNIISKRNPKFTWTAVAGAVQYNLVVMDAGHENLFLDTSVPASSCTGSQCTYIPSTLNLVPGYYSWKVRADFGGGDFTAFSEFIDFTTVNPPAPKFPGVSSTTANPKFIWSKVEGQTQYQVQLFTSSGVKKMDKTLDASVCGSTICSYNPSPVLNLANGAYKWKVRSFNTIWGDYSVLKIFNKVVPPAPISPTGTITLTNPQFTWKNIPGATKYYLVLQTSTGTLKRQVEITAPVCTTTTCSYIPSPVLNLAKGMYKWKVKAFNGYYGPYGVYMFFTKK